MELFPAVPGMVRGVPEGRTGTPRWFEGSIMLGMRSPDADSDGTAALVAGDMTPW